MRFYIKHLRQCLGDRIIQLISVSFLSPPLGEVLSSRHISSFISHQNFPLSVQPISFQELFWIRQLYKLILENMDNSFICWCFRDIFVSEEALVKHKSLPQGLKFQQQISAPVMKDQHWSMGESMGESSVGTPPAFLF